MTSMSEYAVLLPDGTVIEVEDSREWATFFQDFDNRRVALSEIAGYRVSTVFLGLNHSFTPGKKLWFETMIFKGESSHDLYMDRYKTLEEALRGHEIAKGVLDTIRRDENEQELGYRVPNWVWKTREHWRKTEGSGNGRVMRE